MESTKTNHNDAYATGDISYRSLDYTGEPWYRSLLNHMCPHCSRMVFDVDVFCRHCGQQLHKQPKVCPCCGRPMDESP